ncbi:MAG: DUF4248 domain-containing protein [Tannerellaceae bacterium]|nr:DUF4248 domain-containing protein [Tannerellaceae bacterium]
MQPHPGVSSSCVRQCQIKGKNRIEKENRMLTTSQVRILVNHLGEP